MHPSGHTIAQEEHPLHLSSSICEAYGYPFLFTSFWVKAKISSGHATTQRLQPLHRSVSTTIAPLIVAINNSLLVEHVFIIEI